MDVPLSVEEQWREEVKRLRQLRKDKGTPKTELQWREEDGRKRARAKLRRSTRRIGKLITYFIQGKTTGLIKIGKTEDLRERLLMLQSGSPDVLFILKTRSGDSEKLFHRQFAHLRVHGEWFSPATELTKFINEL